MRQLVGFAHGMPVYREGTTHKSTAAGGSRSGGTGTTTSPSGEVVAKVATLNVIDLDGDVVLPGCIPPGGQPVVIGQWNHRSMADATPIGSGVIKEEGGALILRGRLFLDLQAARDHHVILRERGGEQEWSWAFGIRDSAPGTFEGKYVRFLKKVDIMEASPVVRGAGGPGRTGTVELRGAKDPRVLEVERIAAENAEAIRRADGHGRLTRAEKDLVKALDRARALGVAV